MSARIQVVDNRVVVIPYGFSFLEPYLERLADDAATADEAAAAAAASASAAGASATDAENSATTSENSADAAQDSANIATAAEAGVLAAIDGEPITAPVYLNASNVAALQAITERTGGMVVLLTQTGRAGLFEWNVGSFTAQVTADPLKGIYVPAGDDLTGAAGVWRRVVHGDEGWTSWWGTAGDGVIDDQPATQAALDCPLLTVIRVHAATFGLNTQLIIPSGKWLRGSGVGETIFTPLAAYAPRTAGFNQGITCSNTASDVKCTDMSCDGDKIGLGGGAGQRIHAFVPSGTNFYFARLSYINTSGYGVWAFGKDNATPCSGVVEDVTGENADVHFETSIADGVKFVRCHGSSGDGDLPNSAGFHPYNRSTNIEYHDCPMSGTISSPVAIIADAFDIKIRLFNCHIETDAPDATALQPVGPFRLDLEIIGGSYTSAAGLAANIAAGVFLRAIGTEFSGFQIGVGVAADAGVELTSVHITAETPALSGLNTHALYNDGTASVDGVSTLTAVGTLIAAVGGGVAPSLGSNVTLVPAAASPFRERLQDWGDVSKIRHLGGSGTSSQYYIDCVFSVNITDRAKVAIAGMLVHAAASTYTFVDNFSVVATHAASIATNTFRVLLTGIDLGAVDGSNDVVDYRYSWSGIEYE